MDLGGAATEELRAELGRRDKEKQDAEREAIRKAHACPECGGDPEQISADVVEDFVFAPRDSEGRPMLYAAYESGETYGVRRELSVTCVNGHTTRSDFIDWFDRPIPGPVLKYPAGDG